MDNYKNKTKAELIAEIERLKKLNSSLQADNNGGLLEVIAKGTTEEKNSGNELKKQKEMFQLVINSVPARIFWKDLKSVYLGCNSAFAKAAGERKIENIIGKTDFDLVWNKEAKRYINDDKQVLKSGIPKLGYTEDYTLPNGEKVWWQTSKMPLRDSAGKIIGILCTSEDITERKKTETALQENESILNSFFNNTQELMGIIEILPKENDLRYIRINKAAGNHIKLVPEEIKGKLASQVGTSKDLIQFWIEKCLEFERTRVATKFEYQKELDDVLHTLQGTVSLLEPTIYSFVITDITEQKQAENKLKISEENYRTLVENIPGSTYRCKLDKNWPMLFISNEIQNLTGYPASDFLGENPVRAFADIMHPDDRERIWENANTAVSESAPFINEYRIIDKSGDTHYVYAKGQAVFDNNGTPKYLDGTIFDFTTAKEAQKKLKESEEKYRQLYESNQMPISIFDTETLKFLSVNNAFVEKYGYTREEFLNMTILDIRPENEIEKLKHSVEINDNGLVNAGVFLHKKKNGEIIYVEIIRYDLVFEGKKAKLVFANDITERKQIEKELNESEKKYRDLVNMAQEGIWAIDKNNITTFSNPSMANMLGYSPEEMIGKSLFDFMDEAGKKVANENLERRKAGLKEQHDFEFICKNGDRIFCALVTSPILDKTGKYQGAIAGIINITERKQFLKKLQERNEYIESVMDNMPIGFALNSIDDGDVKYMNNRFEEIYGWSRDILTNTSIFFDKVFPDPEYKEKMKTQIIADMQSGDPKKMVWKDLKINTSTGEVRFIDAYNIPLIDQNLMISTVQDTTKRKLAEDEIKKHRENLEELVKERTKNLDEKNEELENMNKLFVGRELKMVELKEKITELQKQIK